MPAAVAGAAEAAAPLPPAAAFAATSTATASCPRSTSFSAAQFAAATSSAELLAAAARSAASSSSRRARRERTVSPALARMRLADSRLERRLFFWKGGRDGGGGEEGREEEEVSVKRREAKAPLLFPTELVLPPEGGKAHLYFDSFNPKLPVLLELSRFSLTSSLCGCLLSLRLLQLRQRGVRCLTIAAGPRFRLQYLSPLRQPSSRHRPLAR